MRPRAAGATGRTLGELLVGAAAAAILTVAVTSLLVAGLRWQRPDQSALVRQQAVRNGVDWVVRDVRRATLVEPLADGLRVVLPEGERTYRVEGGQLWRSQDGGARVVASPVTRIIVAVDPVTRAVRIEVQSAADSRVYRQVSHVMPRVVVP